MKKALKLYLWIGAFPAFIGALWMIGIISINLDVFVWQHIFAIFTGSWIITLILLFVLMIGREKEYWTSIEELNKSKRRYEEASDEYIKARRMYLKEFEDLKLKE